MCRVSRARFDDGDDARTASVAALIRALKQRL